MSGAANGLVGGSGFGTGGSIVTQVGPGLPSLDPYIAASFQIGHYTVPETNTVLNATEALVYGYRSIGVQYGQTFITGTSFQVTLSESRQFYHTGAANSKGGIRRLRATDLISAA